MQIWRCRLLLGICRILIMYRQRVVCMPLFQSGGVSASVLFCPFKKQPAPSFKVQAAFDTPCSRRRIAPLPQPLFQRPRVVFAQALQAAQKPR